MLTAELEHQLPDYALEVSLEVQDRSCLALAGPSGAGKSTILRVLAGILRPRRGTVKNGEVLWLSTAQGVDLPPERRRCGYVFQDFALFPHLSAWRNVAYGMREVERPKRRAAALSLLERFELEGLADARPARMSGGERQRVALARALASRPSALLLDEPLSALDTRTRASATRSLLSILNSLEVPVVLVTHDFHEAARVGDEVGVIDQGKLIQQGPANVLAAAPASAFVADFVGSVVLTGSVAGTGGGVTVIELDGGGSVRSTGAGVGRVAVSVFPWEITIGRADALVGESSARNELTATVSSLTEIGGRVRLGLTAGQPLVAEVTSQSVSELELNVGSRVLASWKATATRLSPL